MKWPRSKPVQAIVAILAALPLAWFVATSTARISLGYFNEKYPHDGQNGLGALAVFVFAFPVAFILGSLALYFLERRLIK